MRGYNAVYFYKHDGEKKMNLCANKVFFVCFSVWERLVKAWKGWREAAATAKEAKMAAREAKMAAAVEARMVSARKAEEGALYPNLAESGTAASAPSGDGE